MYVFFFVCDVNIVDRNVHTHQFALASSSQFLFSCYSSHFNVCTSMIAVVKERCEDRRQLRRELIGSH